MRSNSSVMRARSRVSPALDGERCLYRAATFVTEHDEQLRVQVHACILQCAHDFGRNYVARHAHDEQLSEARVEQEFRRYARVATADNGRIGALTLGQLSENLLLHGRESGLPVNEAFVARNELSQRFFCGIGPRDLLGCRHVSSSSGV